MALSGTTLTLTTLTTAGILSNNASGQISSVTGSGLAALLGGAPSFTGLTLSGLNSVLLKTNGSGVVSAAVANTDYQAALSAGLNITLAGNVCATSATPSFTGLTLSGTLSTLLKTDGAGLIQAAAAGTDYQAPITAGTNITLTSNTIATSLTPAFTALLCTTVGTRNTLCGTNAGANLTSGGTGSNVLLGYNAGAAVTSGGSNVAIGPNAMSAGSALTSAAGNNIGVGPSALLNLSGSATNNVGIGLLAGSTLTTGSYCVLIGTNAQPSSATVTNELVVSNTNTSVTGKGANTAFFNYPSGLYSYSPAYCMLYSTAFNNSNVTWAFWTDGITTYNSGFTLYSSNTIIVQPVNAVYKITFSGSAVCHSNTTQLILTATNVKTYDISLNSGGAMSGYAVSINGSTLSRPYAAAGGASSGWSVNMQGCYYWRAQDPLYMMIEYYSL
jgi:hypothetical protein